MGLVYKETHTHMQIIILENMITNVNYKARLVDASLVKFPAGQQPPYQLIYPLSNGAKMLVFGSGKCRIMGLKSEKMPNLPFPIKDLTIQSASAVMYLNRNVNLKQLAKVCKSTFEPELFPALRLHAYDPLCVNVFSNGKITILGLKQLSNNDLFWDIETCINSLI